MDMYYLILVIPALILSIYAQTKVTSTFKKYSQVLSRSNVSGSYAAQTYCKMPMFQGFTYIRQAGHLPTITIPETIQ